MGNIDGWHAQTKREGRMETENGEKYCVFCS